MGQKKILIKINLTVYWICNVIECTTRVTVKSLGNSINKEKYVISEFHPTNDLQVCVKNKQFYKTFFMNDECSNKL